MDRLWGDSGPAVSWKFNSALVAIGSRVDIVVELVSFDVSSGGALVCMWPCKARARIFGGLFDIGEETESLTIFGAVYVDSIGMPGFRVDRHSEVLCHPRITYDDMFNLVELCAGMGVGTQGFHAVGMKTVVAAEIQQKTAAAFKELHPNTEVVCGDISDAGTIIEVFRRHPRSSVVMAGFSCQPYSAGGEKQGYGDRRSQTLVGVLKAAILLRCPILVLECVRNAGSNRFVRQMVESFRDELGFHLAEGYLALDSCWVSRRDRWWAILTAPVLGAISIPPLPHLAFPTKLRHILPKPYPCGDHELEELVLQVDEMRKLVALVPDLRSVFLPLNSKCPTCLHAWGSQFSDCPCGCRTAFSETTLRDRGVYGIFIPTGKQIVVDGRTFPEVRHPHPTEVGWANGVLMPPAWPQPLKLSLAGLGQQASPIHCLWVASQIVHHVNKLHFGASSVSGSHSLDAWIGKLLKQIQDVMGTLGHVCMNETDGSQLVELIPPDDPLPVSTLADRMPWHSLEHKAGDLCVTVVDAASCCPVVVRLSSRVVTLADLLAAEKSLSPDREITQVVDCATSLVVDEHEEIAGRCLWCESSIVSASSSVAGQGEAFVDAISPTLPWTAPAVDDIPGLEFHHPSLPRDSDVLGSGFEDPLGQLSDKQLTAVRPPKVDSVHGLSALSRSCIAVDDRLSVLANQNGTWADDEVGWHVNRMLNEAGRRDWTFIPPILAAECLARNGVRLLTQWFASLSTPPCVLLGAVPVGGHWIPFMWTWTSEVMTAHSWDVAGNTPRCLNVLHDALSKVVGAKSFICHTAHRQFATSDHCGLCTVRWLDHKIRGRMLPTSLDEVHYLHGVARTQFADFVSTQTSLSRPWIWASGLDAKASVRLRDVLVQHGVPVEQLDGRVALVSQALGVQSLQDALTSSNPWRMLKQLANQQKPPLQIVMPEELAKVVQSRASQGKVSSTKKGSKGKGKGAPVRPPAMDPSKLVIEPDSFVTSDMKVLSQLDANSIGPLSEGVFLATQQTVEAHLRAGSPLSQGSLAAVLLNVDEPQLKTTLPWNQIRVVLRCKLNQEPILISAVLVQLGLGTVSQSTTASSVRIPDTPAACVKIAVYRDAIDIPWKDFAQAPIKYILSVLQPLVVCSTCDSSPVASCVRWHSHEGQLEDPVLDMWRRQWTSCTFKPCDASESSIFWVNVRYVGAIEQAVLKCSGHRGVFLEPRSLDCKTGTLDYQVIWLPKETLSELQRLQQRHIEVIGLARLGSRLGLRVSSADAAELTKVVKPGAMYLATGERQEYEAGPLPFGMDRLSLTKLCEAWKWQARPLHPIRSLEDGLGTVWLLQSCHEPPEMVLKYQGGNVIIGKVEKKLPSAGVASSVVGGSATMALCQLDAALASKPVDPWLKFDPWQSCVGGSVTAPGGPLVDKQIQQLEDRIEQKVLAKVTPPPGDGDFDMDRTVADGAAVEARFQALESQMMQLSTRNQALEDKIESCSQSNDAQISQLQHQVAAQFEAQRSEMQGLFSSQMNQIEALLAKKPRRE